MKKIIFNLTATGFLAVLICSNGFAQPIASPKETEVSRERREQAYVKLLEGQRYLWQINQRRTAETESVWRLAKQSFQKSVELDPTLAEGYTALAQLALSSPQGSIEDALMLSNIAVKINPDNFGARRILARLYTIKSRLNNGKIDDAQAQKAISEWKEVARLDPRNAEAWAFLSEFYGVSGKDDDRIDALKRWLASSSPLEPYFYRRVMNDREDLSTDTAMVKLGATLIKANRLTEAVEILSRAVAEQPENSEAIDLLREAIGGADGESVKKAVEALQQASFANPNNLVLIELLAETQFRSGNIDGASKTLRGAAEKLSDSDKNKAAALLVVLGDIYAEAERTNDAITTFNESLKLSGIDKTPLTDDTESEFAAQVFARMIAAYKYANRYAEAKAVIDRAAILLNKDDNFAARQTIQLLLETGKRQEALQTLRSLRVRFPADEILLRQEAMMLAESGKIEEAVALVKTLLKGRTSSAPSALQNDFGNWLYISTLYSQAKAHKEAISAALEALKFAESEERKQIAKLTLATAQQNSGDFTASETTLREILKQTPGNPIALNNLGYFLLERNEKIDEAVSLIKQAVKIDPTNPSYLDSLGWAYFKIGKFSEAEKYLRDAARRSSDSSTIYEHLGDVYSALDKKDLAKLNWQKALNLATDPEDVSRIRKKLGLKTGNLTRE